MNNETFIKELKDIGIVLTEKQLDQLEEYYKLLIEWNNKFNLTNITDKEQVYLKHFYDSLTITKVIDLNQDLKLCDIGTGAGFPGIVLKIVFPKLKITLIDSLNKRITFLNEVINKLELENIEAIHSRAEEYSKNNRETQDIVVSRAVANLRVLSELCIPLLKVNGNFIAMKANVENEINESKSTLSKLDSNIVKIESFNLPIEKSIRNIVLIKKEKETNKKFPRTFDKIKKNPL